ncbi:uncharacterized protein LOC133545391 isoform X2 [Nerophis ophidion]|uniref:uncharacterized protein LOC133545391 isoform X2 n=1 Tax=Nerophis ophidion TaxID=159077 RepID=UPI002ADF29F5|nr:uncharacterized protein LOC133545391 isoform X2 [Nerophis ophidion]
MCERTIAKYEEEICPTKEEKEQQHQLLDAVFKKHQIVLHKTDLQQPPHIKEEEVDPQPPHIKEEDEEVWITQEEECLLGQEEADLSKFPLTVVSVKTEEHEDKPPESSQLHHSPTMEASAEMDEPVVLSTQGRKKKRMPEGSARALAKKARHSGDGKLQTIACAHNNNAMCVASTLSPEDLAYMKGQFYLTQDKVKQDATLLSYMDVQTCKRRRTKVTDTDKQKQREVSVKYYLLKASKERISVCKASFLSILCVNKDRVSHVAKYWLENGVAMPEQRGGARTMEQKLEKKRAIQDHIQTFTCRASHYARRGAPGRKYLPSDLSVKKMHQLFLDQNHQQCSYALYYSVFCYDFNLWFGHPAKDVCSECVKLKLRLKDPELTETEKREELIEFLLHRRRARSFYDIMNSVGDTFTVCFDIMENLVLPKTPIGQAYYSRQLYMYVFGVVRHREAGMSQGKDDINLYVWMEHENGKGSNMVASALNHYFSTVVHQAISQVQHLRLFSDSSYGQNKNISVLTMLLSLKKRQFPDLTIEYTFPVRGHSFLPADRAFGRIELDIRKKESVLLPEDYIDILQRHGRVHRYTQDWHCFDFKAAAGKHCQYKRSFKLSEAKSLLLGNDHPDQVGIKQTYNGEYCFHSLLKRGKKWEQFTPAEASPVNTVKPAKKTDVLKLLFDVGASTRVREFYTAALKDVVEHGANVDSDDE